jgi:formamidopyrimidine-DNA glycosylase
MKGIPPFSYKEFRIDTEQWPPKHSRLLLHCESVECAFTDSRRFGKVWIVSHPFEEPPLVNLGPDAYLHLPPLSDFSPLIQSQGKNKTLKSVLLDQSVLSGLGNWMADEILHQAQLHPSQSIQSLRQDHLVALWNAIHVIVKISVECNANDDEYPKHWLFHSRWNRGKHRQEKALKWMTVAGRTTVFCPSIQKKV